MPCDMVAPPPPYAIELAKQPVPCVNLAQEVEIVLFTPQCYYGCSIQGIVKITPRISTTVYDIRLVLVARERSGRYGRERPLIVKTELTSSCFNVDAGVNAGYTYSLTFSMQFPYLNWIGSCKCGKGHQVLPPSLSPHGPTNMHLNCESSYAIQAHLDGRSMAVSYLNFLPPSVSECELAGPIVKKLPPALRAGFASPGSLRADILPPVHWGKAELPGVIDMILYWVPKTIHAPPMISSVGYRILKCVSRATVLGEMTQSYIVGYGTAKAHCEWVNNRANLTFEYKFNVAAELLQVSYSGCLTSVYYTIDVNLAKARFKARILVGTDGLPSYTQPFPKLVEPALLVKL